MPLPDSEKNAIRDTETILAALGDSAAKRFLSRAVRWGCHLYFRRRFYFAAVLLALFAVLGITCWVAFESKALKTELGRLRYQVGNLSATLEQHRRHPPVPYEHSHPIDEIIDEIVDKLANSPLFLDAIVANESLMKRIASEVEPALAKSEELQDALVRRVMSDPEVIQRVSVEVSRNPGNAPLVIHKIPYSIYLQTGPAIKGPKETNKEGRHVAVATATDEPAEHAVLGVPEDFVPIEAFAIASSSLTYYDDIETLAAFVKEGRAFLQLRCKGGGASQGNKIDVNVFVVGRQTSPAP